jgi:uncharacterized protein (DUF2164 family)
MPNTSPMRIRLSAERRAVLLTSLTKYFSAEFDDPLSEFKANGLVDFFVRELGPPVYNQGVKDATGFIQSKLEDIEGEIYERES